MVTSSCQTQVPIFELLKKFDSVRVSDDIKLGRRRFRITKLPQFLVLHVKRFINNRYFTEKNPTIVNFPVKNLELRDIIPTPTGAAPCPTALAGTPCQFACHVPLLGP